MNAQSGAAFALLAQCCLISSCTGGLNLGTIGGGAVAAPGTPRPLITAQVQTQTLAPVLPSTATTKTATKTATDAAATPKAAEIPEAAPKSPQEAACRASGGRWGHVGNTITSACVRPTKDAGKSCTKESDCSSQCLARSRTCAPFWPIFGCSEVIQNNGVVAKLCLQ